MNLVFAEKKLANAKKRRPSQRCMRDGIADKKTFFDQERLKRLEFRDCEDLAGIEEIRFCNQILVIAVKTCT